MTFIIVTALLLAQGAQTAPAQGKPTAQAAPLTLTGCIQQTGDADVFLLSVPNVVPPRSDAATGTAGANAGSRGATGAAAAARGNSRDATARNETMENKTYKLVGLNGDTLRPLVSRAVEVVGELLPTPQGAERINPELRAKSIRKIADSCAEIIRK